MVNTNYVGHKKKYRIPLFCFVTVLFWFSMYTYVPILTVYVKTLGASNKLAGIIVGTYGFTQMVFRIPIGIASDRIHKRKLFIHFGLFFALLSAFGLWVTKDLTLILIFRSFAGAAAGTWVDFTILFVSYYNHDESTKAIGIISCYNSIGQMLAMLAGGFLAEKKGWQAPFLLGAVAAAVALLISFFLIEKFEENPQKIYVKGILDVMRDHTLLIVSLLAVLSQMATFATVFGFTPLYANFLGASKLEMSLLTVFSSLSTAIASIYGGGYLTDKFGEKKVVVFGFILTGIFITTISFTSNLWILILTQTITGVGRGLSFPVLMGLSIKYMPSEKRAVAMGFYQSIYGLGMFVGPLFMGIIGDVVSLKWGFIFIGIVSCLTAVLAQVIIKTGIEGKQREGI